MGNTNYVKQKKIIVKSFGLIDALGGVVGPVLAPFKADTIPTIRNLINSRMEVYEILDNGQELKLDIRNFETDNNVAKVSKPVETTTADVKPVNNNNNKTVETTASKTNDTTKASNNSDKKSK